MHRHLHQHFSGNLTSGQNSSSGQASSIHSLVAPRPCHPGSAHPQPFNAHSCWTSHRCCPSQVLSRRSLFSCIIYLAPSYPLRFLKLVPWPFHAFITTPSSNIRGNNQGAPQCPPPTHPFHAALLYHTSLFIHCFQRTINSHPSLLCYLL